eukprot:TRINITY_DN3053_c0_g2_i2.p1 TRINITY_DN3053_c0_g2~~TRINITY_DN3053_c0_g2_i2.p1  ORF type:complete len:571 (+),score=150.93 TRINITY_DN3053_c0_g2_i2:65-1777(+)
MCIRDRAPAAQKEEERQQSPEPIQEVRQAADVGRPTSERPRIIEPRQSNEFRYIPDPRLSSDLREETEIRQTSDRRTTETRQSNDLRQFLEARQNAEPRQSRDTLRLNSGRERQSTEVRQSNDFRQDPDDFFGGEVRQSTEARQSMEVRQSTDLRHAVEVRQSKDVRGSFDVRQSAEAHDMRRSGDDHRALVQEHFQTFGVGSLEQIVLSGNKLSDIHEVDSQELSPFVPQTRLEQTLRSSGLQYAQDEEAPAEEVEEEDYEDEFDGEEYEAAPQEGESERLPEYSEDEREQVTEVYDPHVEGEHIKYDVRSSEGDLDSRDMLRASEDFRADDLEERMPRAKWGHAQTAEEDEEEKDAVMVFDFGGNAANDLRLKRQKHFEEYLRKKEEELGKLKEKRSKSKKEIAPPLQPPQPQFEPSPSPSPALSKGSTKRDASKGKKGINANPFKLPDPAPPEVTFKPTQVQRPFSAMMAGSPAPSGKGVEESKQTGRPPIKPGNQKNIISFTKANNKQLIKNALSNVCLAGEPNRKERELVLSMIGDSKGENLIIVFKGPTGRQVRMCCLACLMEL